MFFSPRRSAVLSLLGLSLSVLPSCAPKPARVSANLVFLPFEYLGSAPTLEWTGLAVPGIASVQSSSLALPGIREAHINRIDHVVDGYITGGPGDLRVTAAVRDEKSQRTLRTLEARGTTVLEAASTLARQLNDKPKAYTSNNPEAIKEFFSGHVDAAVALDPSFGAAQVSRVEALLRTGRKEDLPAAIASARASNLTDLERARLEALVADTPKKRAEALLGLARAARYDLELWRARPMRRSPARIMARPSKHLKRR